jgi:hypothetical protein
MGNKKVKGQKKLLGKGQKHLLGMGNWVVRLNILGMASGLINFIMLSFSFFLGRGGNKILWEKYLKILIF